MGKSYLTENCPGTGGTIKSFFEDFQVEEIPLYLPCGEGEHLYLHVEKQGLTTLDLVKKLARQSGLQERDFGYAGLKDARGITRQWISLPASAGPFQGPSGDSSFRILAQTRHRNKLRLGHLSGNRFRIRIRETLPQALPLAQATFAELEKKGVPNSFGPQRFGIMGNSHDIGRAILKGDFSLAAREIIGRPDQIQDPDWQSGAEKFIRGDLAGALAELPWRLREERRLVENLLRGKTARKAVLELPKRLLRLYLSAYQAELFDVIVAERLPHLGILWEGDLAVKHSNGAFFLVEDARGEQARADALEISPSGPLFGYRSSLAKGRAGSLETELLQRENLGPEDFRLGGGLKMEGGRRPLRVPLKETALEKEGEDLIVSFVLPAGSYATNVTDEIMKTDNFSNSDTASPAAGECLSGEGQTP